MRVMALYGMTALFLALWVLLPGWLAARWLTSDRATAFVVAFPAGIFVHLLMFSLAVGTGWYPAYLVLYPGCALAVGVHCALKRNGDDVPIGRNGLANLRSLLNTKEWAVVGMFAAALLAYRHGVMDAGNMLPARPGEPAFAWIDMAWFSGNAASLKYSVLPLDYRVAGSPLHYHYFYQQLAAAASRTTRLELFDLFTRSFPTLLTIEFVIAIALMVRRLGGGVLQMAAALTLGVLSGAIGWRFAFEAGADTLLNFFTSPTILAGFSAFLAIPALLVDAPERLLGVRGFAGFAALFFVMTGLKISVGAEALASLTVWCAWRALFSPGMTARFASRALPGALTGAWVGAGLAYVLCFWERGGGLASTAALAFPSPFLVRLGSLPPRLTVLLTGLHAGKHLSWLVGAVLRHLPILLVLTFAAWRDRREAYRHLGGPRGFLFLCASCGVLAGIIQPDVHDPLHFYHQGIFCFGLLAGLSVVRLRSQLLIIALSAATALSLFPAIGDLSVPYFSGRMADGAPELLDTDLDFHLLAAFRHIRAFAAPADVVLTGKTRLNPKAFGDAPFAYFASAFAERPVYLEGYGFSGSAAARSAVEPRSRLQDRLFDARTSPAEVAGLLAIIAPRPRWIVWDERSHGPEPRWLEEHFSESFRSGPVSVLRTSER